MHCLQLSYTGIQHTLLVVACMRHRWPSPTSMQNALLAVADVLHLPISVQDCILTQWVETDSWHLELYSISMQDTLWVANAGRGCCMPHQRARLLWRRNAMMPVGSALPGLSW